MRTINTLYLNAATKLTSTFHLCSSLVTVDLRNTNNVTSFTNTFANCFALRNINVLNMQSWVTGWFFNACRSLNSARLLNVPINLSTVIIFSNSDFTKNAAIQLFNDLPDRSSGTTGTQVINLTTTPAASSLTLQEKLIAINKNYVIQV